MKTELYNQILTAMKNIVYSELNQDNLYDLLQDNHGIDNPYHQEGSFLTHLNLVKEQAELLYPDDEILHIACFLHDVGKPFCKVYDSETNKTYFRGHESYSVFVAYDVIKYLINNFNFEISRFDLLRILSLIQRHADPYSLGIKKLVSRYTRAEYNDLIKIHRCDSLGRTPAKDPIIYDINLFKEKFEFNPSFDNKIIYMIGIPNSGKSTYIKELTKFNDFKVISRDDIIMNLSNTDDYNKAFNEVNQDLVDSEYNKLYNLYMQNKENFIIDKTNTTYKTRNKNIKEFNSHKIGICFCIGLSEILKRNNLRTNKKLNLSVINKFMTQFQFPYSNEFETIYYVFE